MRDAFHVPLSSSFALISTVNLASGDSSHWRNMTASFLRPLRRRDIFSCLVPSGSKVPKDSLFTLEELKFVSMTMCNMMASRRMWASADRASGKVAPTHEHSDNRMSVGTVVMYEPMYDCILCTPYQSDIRGARRRQKRLP